MFSTEIYNAGVKSITSKKTALLKAAISSLNIGQTGELLKTIRTNYKQSFGEIDAIGFAMTKGGVMTEKGVGRGIKIDSAKTNGAVIGRRAKPWFAPIMDNTVAELADFVASQKADALINAIQI